MQPGSTAIDTAHQDAAALNVPAHLVAALRGEAPPEPTCDIWPDNIPAANLFRAMLTQWRVGPGGLVGLDYTAIEPVRRSLHITSRKAARLLPDLQVMEQAALELAHAST